MIGHDLRNPLTSIQAATYYLKTKSAKDMSDTSKQMLETIEKSIRYSNKIVNDLLEYSAEVKPVYDETTPKSLTASALELTPVPENVKLVFLAQDFPTLRWMRSS